jgi:hypothetical protein
MLIGEPQQEELEAAFKKAHRILEQTPVDKEIVLKQNASCPFLGKSLILVAIDLQRLPHCIGFIRANRSASTEAHGGRLHVYSLASTSCRMMASFPSLRAVYCYAECGL